MDTAHGQGLGWFFVLFLLSSVGALLSGLAAIRARLDARRARISLDVFVTLWKLSIPDDMRKLAEQAARACAEREAELEKMSPEERTRAIDAWARNLAEQTAGLDD